MWGSIISGLGSIAGGFLGSSGADKAAELQAEGVTEAQRIAAENAKLAREDALGLYDPALSDYNKAMGMSLEELRDSGLNIQDILKNYSGQANDVLMQTGNNVAASIMGVPTNPLQINPSGGEYVSPNINRGNTGGDLVNALSGEGINESIAGNADQGPSGPTYGNPGDDYMLPQGVTREAFQRTLDQMGGKGFTKEDGTPFTDKEYWDRLAQHTQDQAKNNYFKSQGYSRGRDSAEAAAPGGQGQVGMAFPNWERQTYAPPWQERTAPAPTPSENQLAQIMQGINFGG